MDVYLYRNDEQYGPYSLEQVQAFVDDGTYTPIDSVWFDGCVEWTTISNLPGIVISEEKRRQHLVPPFEAYTGDNPYVFVSYAHADGELVFREIRKLHEAGYRIWYDEGIDPGNDWPEHIAKAVIDCDLFLMFTSPRSAASENCRNEVNLALNRKKKFLAVYLEETDLPPGLELRMGDLQAVLKFRMPETTYRKKVFTGLENLLGEGGRDVPEGEDPVAAAMAVEIVADFLAAPVENENGSYPPDEQFRPTKTKGKWFVIGLAIACCAALLFLLQEYKAESEPVYEVETPEPTDPLEEERLKLIQQMKEAKEEANIAFAKLDKVRDDLDQREQRDKLEQRQAQARNMVEKATSLENYFWAIERARQVEAYGADSLPRLEKVVSNSNLFQNDSGQLNRGLLFQGPDDVWDKIKAGAVGLHPENSQSEYLALSASVNTSGIRDVWRHQHFQCKAVLIRTPPRGFRVPTNKYITERKSLGSLFSFGRIQQKESVAKRRADGKAVPSYLKVEQQGDFFIEGRRQHRDFNSTHWGGNVDGETLENSELTAESRFTQEKIEKFLLLDNDTIRIRAPLLELVDALLADQTVSLPFKAVMHDKLADIIQPRADEWGVTLAPRFIKDHRSLKAILKGNLKLTDWMNPSFDTAMEHQISLFYQGLSERRYASSAKFNASILHGLSTLSFRFSGRIDEFGGPIYLQEDNPRATPPLVDPPLVDPPLVDPLSVDPLSVDPLSVTHSPTIRWCLGWEGGEAVLQRFTGLNALPFSPLLETDLDLQFLFEEAFAETGFDGIDVFDGAGVSLPFRYSEE